MNAAPIETPTTQADSRPWALMDWAVAGLGVCLALGAYLEAWSRIRPGGGPNPLSPWEDALPLGGWLAITLLLGGSFWKGVSRGVPWRRALPRGYQLALAACLALGLASILDLYWSRAFGPGQGLEALVSPFRLAEIAAAAIIVAGPLRAAMDREEEVAGIPALLSAGLVLSALTFFTQFAHPLVDVWSATGSRIPAQAEPWVGRDLGVAGLLMQSTLITALVLLLLRRFHIPAGGLTLVLGLNGLLVAILKLQFVLLPVPVLTGLVADILLLVLRPSPARPARLRSFAALVPSTYVALYLVDVVMTGGTGWSAPFWAGMLTATALVGWLLSYLVFPLPARGGEAMAAGISVQHVKEALDELSQPAALAASPLARLPCITSGGREAAVELSTLLTDMIREVAASPSPIDAEAGQVLVDYYLRRAGSHEVIAERLHLSRPTFYRRLQRGLGLIAARLAELNQLAVRSA